MEDHKFQELVLSKFEQISNKLDQNDKIHEQIIHQLEILADSVDTLAVNQEQIQLDITNVRQSQTRLEQDLNKKITALFDFRESQIDITKNFLLN